MAPWMVRLVVFAASCAVSLWPETGALAQSTNLIANPSFEVVPCATPCNRDQGFLPTGWISLSFSPDTYSNDGSYGLAPGGFGHFPGVTAPDGIRWVAGASSPPEILGQTGVALTPGMEYTISAFLHQDNGTGGFALPRPGGYRVELWDGTTLAADKLVLGTFDLTTDPTSWEFRTFSFIAPAGASTHTVLAFVPVGSPQGSAYPGIDNVSLTLVAPPVPRLRIVRRLAEGVGGAPADGASVNPAVTPDGRFVAFESTATNLVPSGCTGGVRQIFLRDRLAGTAACLSVAPNGAPGNGPSSRPTISADGRFVAFESTARNLVATACGGGTPHVYVRDRQAGVTTCIAVGPGGVPGDADSHAPSVSGDGNLVAFVSAAGNLGGDCAGGGSHVYLRDRAAQTTTCLSVGPGGAPGDGPSGAPAISRTGGVVAFESAATNLVAAGCSTGTVQVFVRDLATGTTTCASTSQAGTPGDNASGSPVLSADGSVVAFESTATNLVASGCTTGSAQVFVKNRPLNQIQCVSVAPDGTPGNGPGGAPAISGDGRRVVFTSQATNLTSGALAAASLRRTMAQLPPGPAGSFLWVDTAAVVDAVTAILTGTASGTGDRLNGLSDDGTLVVTEMLVSGPGPTLAAVEDAAVPPAGQPLITAPAAGTAFSLVGAITLTFQWTAVTGAAGYRLAFTGPVVANVDVAGATSFPVILSSDIPPGAYQVRVIPLGADGAPGTPSDPVPFSLVPGVVLVLADRPYFTTPGGSVTISRGQPLTFAWTVLAGVLQYGFEFTGVDRVFANPNAAVPDGVNGFGGAGGGFLVVGTSVTPIIPAGIPAGSYQVRVIGLSASGATVGSFSDAVTVLVQ